MTEPSEAAVEIISLIVDRDSPYTKDPDWNYNAKLLDAERIIQRLLDERGAKIMKLKMECVSAANEICNWRRLACERDAEIERLKDILRINDQHAEIINDLRQVERDTQNLEIEQLKQQLAGGGLTKLKGGE